MPELVDEMTKPRSRRRYRPPPDIHELQTTEVVEVRLEDRLKVPAVLYVAGDVELLNAPRRVAVIGSRAASREGLRRAAKIARLLSRAGTVVVSGLAKGIDRAAHEGGMEVGGRTIAVIGTPLDRAYPAAHAELQEQIYRNHLLVSQFPAASRTYPSSFIARNRTMALLSHASIIVEAGDTSGALSQAAETQRLGRALFIMQSVLDRPDISWPQRFLDAGAHVLSSVEQVVDILPP